MINDLVIEVGEAENLVNEQQLFSRVTVQCTSGINLVSLRISEFFAFGFGLVHEIFCLTYHIV